MDAAWGGPVMLSDKYAGLLDGIREADSVTIDCHKQFYMPMSAGMVFFKDPTALDRIIYHAGYVNRKGSVDLGIKTLEGSREAGKSFVSRTCLKIHPDDAHTPVVLRSVIMNPYTDGRVLDQILDEQETILQSPEILQHQKIGFMAPI